MTESDSKLLQQHAREQSVMFSEVNAAVVASSPYRTVLWIGDEGLSDDDPTQLSQGGFSSAFVNLLQWVYEDAQGFCYVILDRNDGQIVDLPTFEW